MHNAKLERFSFLLSKGVNQSATSQVLAEYYQLLEQWNQFCDHNVFDDFFLPARQDSFDDE